MSDNTKSGIHAGMTARQARRLEYGIIGFCLLALFCIFQPFSIMLFTIGCIGVVVGGLAFNLVPFCKAGTSLAQILRVALIVLAVLVVAICLALGSAWLYGVYLKAG
jgi:hypothetical protein